MDFIREQFSEAKLVLDEFSTEKNFREIQNAGDVFSQALLNGNKVISCGNGGSMSDAMHFAEELSGRYRGDRKALPAMAISDSGHITCVGNDYGYDQIFSRFIDGFGKEGDVLLAISTSGNSANVINAINSARNAKMKVIGLTGKDGGKMCGICDVEIRAPHSEFADRVQEIHIKVIHALIGYIESQVC